MIGGGGGGAEYKYDFTANPFLIHFATSIFYEGVHKGGDTAELTFAIPIPVQSILLTDTSIKRTDCAVNHSD